MPGSQRLRARLFWAALALFGAGLVADGPASAQNLDAGKSPAQLFTENCTACHRSPQGLAKGRTAATLAGFLRQHYTTGREPASQLAGYLASVGGAAQAAPPRRAPAGAETHRSESGAQSKPPAAPAAGRTASAPAPTPAAPPPRRARRAGELASVSSDPEPVTMSERPVPVVHHRASSQAQEARDLPMPPIRGAEPAQTAAAAKPGENGAAQEPAGRGDAQPPSDAKPAAEPQPFDGPLP